MRVMQIVNYNYACFRKLFDFRLIELICEEHDSRVYSMFSLMIEGNRIFYFFNSECSEKINWFYGNKLFVGVC